METKPLLLARPVSLFWGRTSPIHKDRFQTAFSWSDLIYVLDVPETCRCYPGHSREPIRRIVMREYFFSLVALV